MMIEANKNMILIQSNWTKSLNAYDYTLNQPLIEKLIEDYQTLQVYCIDQDTNLKDEKTAVKKLELENQSLRQSMKAFARLSKISIALSLMALILIGLGINLVSAIPPKWIGWMLIIFGCCSEFISCYLKSQERK